MTQKQLADDAGVSTATLRELKKGRADREWQPSTLAKISRALDWHPGHLLAVAQGAPPPILVRDDRVEAPDEPLLAELRAIREHLERIDAQISKLADRESAAGQPG
ncbi:putative transcriptional regulator, XRE family [Parafrankia sp. EUN1f]|nr:putative transcriptional regulator, XRE family [Parafrankia sp. EUN1f]